MKCSMAKKDMKFIYWCSHFIVFLYLAQADLLGGLRAVEEIGINFLKYKYYGFCHLNPFELQAVLATRIPTPPVVPLTDKNVRFLFYSRKNPRRPEVIVGDEPASNIAALDFDFSKETVIFCDGYSDRYMTASALFPSALLPQKDVNIIITDWSSYAFLNKFYTTNVTTPRLGEVIGDFLEKLISVGVDPKKTTLMGFSAGTQAVSLAAKRIRPKVSRLIGFSPDGTCFDFQPNDQRLVPGDADFVVIVHCSTGIYEYSLRHVGDATFYINGGVLQPQCIFERTVVKQNDCSHNSCMFYLYFSLLNINTFKGVKCDNYEDYLMGKCDCDDTAALIYDIPSSTRGLYFIDTNFAQKKIC